MTMNIGERDQLKSAKIAVLKLINDHKDILFGKISDTLTREVKEAKWEEVADQAHSLGAFPWHRSWDYLKDTTWQNWRKRFVEKREKREAFGPAKIKYDEADLLIMEILDSLGGGRSRESQNYSAPNPPTIRDISDVLEIEFDIKNELSEELSNGGNHLPDEHQLGMNGGHESHVFPSDSTALLPDLENGYDSIHSTYLPHGHSSTQNQSNFIANGAAGTEASSRSDGVQPKIMSTSSLSTRASALRRSAYASLRSAGGVSSVRKRPASLIAGSSVVRSVEKELADLKCRKIRAELDLLQRESYKTDLEILQLERSLGLPASHITKKFNKTGHHSIMKH